METIFASFPPSEADPDELATPELNAEVSPPSIRQRNRFDLEGVCLIRIRRLDFGY